MLFINITTYQYAQMYHYIVIVLCFLLMCSPDVAPFIYIHRRTIFNIILHDNGISQFGTNIRECILSGIGFTMWYILFHVIVVTVVSCMMVCAS